MGIRRVAPVAPEEQDDEFNKVKALIKLFLAMLFQTLFANNIFENYQLCKICFDRICADIIDAENIEKINYFMQLIKLTVNAKKQFNIFVVDPDHLYIDIDENGMLMPAFINYNGEKSWYKGITTSSIKPKPLVILTSPFNRASLLLP